MLKLLYILFTALMLPVIAYSQALDRTYLNYINPLQYGATCSQATLAATLTAIGSNAKTLILPVTDRAKAACNWSITADVTIPANVTLVIPLGTIITIASTKVLTITGLVECEPNQHCFTGSGTVYFPDTSKTPLAYAEWFGALGDGTTNDETAWTKVAVAHRNTKANPGKVYKGASDGTYRVKFQRSNSVFTGYGSKFYDMALSWGSTVEAAPTTDIAILGLQADYEPDTSGGMGAVLELTGVSNIIIRDLTIDNPVEDRYRATMYIRSAGASYLVMDNFEFGRTFATGPLNIEHCQFCRFSNFFIRTNDDGIAISNSTTAVGDSHDITITNGHITGGTTVGIAGDFVALGGLIGTGKKTYNVTVSNLTGRASFPLYYKSTSVDGGIFESVTVTNISVDDPTGLNLRSMVNMQLDNGTILRAVTLSNLTARARRHNIAGPTSFIMLDAKGTGTVIEDVLLANITFIDTEDGAAGTAAPFSDCIQLRDSTSTGGIVRRVTIDNLSCRGAYNSGIRLDSEVDNVTIINPKIRHAVVTPDSSLDAGIRLDNATNVRILGSPLIEVDTAAREIRADNGSGGYSTFAAREETVFIGTLAAGSLPNNMVWQAPENCYVYQAYITVGATITADATNRTSAELYKETGATQLGRWSTNTVGGSTWTAFVPVQLFNGATSTTINYPMSSGRMDKGTTLRLAKTDSGTGAIWLGAQLHIKWVPFR